MSTSTLLSNLKTVHRHNVRTFRAQPLAEIAGSLGDLGTFLPILIAMSSHTGTAAPQISLSTTLILTGVYNIVTGVLFGIPLPVQPMKAIAAVAILKGLSAGSVAAAGIFVSASILIFSVTGLLEWVTRVVPIPVVKGIQVGAGLSLIIAAGSKALAELDWIGPSWADNRLWIIIAFLALFATNLRPRVPYALVLFILGLVFAVIRILSNENTGYHIPGFRVWHPYAFVPFPWEWRAGILDAGLGQLPLTTLNSVIAVVHLAADLLPEVRTPSVTEIGFSVAAMNLIGCWFGAMPTCHGSGGLAAQYRFGARSGASIIFLGALKLIIGLVFGNSLLGLLDRFPLALLTVMIIAAGIELASVGESLNDTSRARDLKKRDGIGRLGGTVRLKLSERESKERWTVMILTAGTLVAFKNDAVGFLAGLCCHFAYMLAYRLETRSSAELVDDAERSLLS